MPSEVFYSTGEWLFRNQSLADAINKSRNHNIHVTHNPLLRQGKTGSAYRVGPVIPLSDPLYPWEIY